MSQLIEIEGQFYIAANSSLADAATRVLKHADTFAIFDRHGDIRPLGFENQGLFHEGTRFISRLKLEINGQSPLLLSSTVKEDNDLLVADLTNPPLTNSDGSKLLSGTIHLVRHIFLWDGECFEQIEIANFGLTPATFDLSSIFRADFADLFEVRGMTRERRGHSHEPAVDRDGVLLQYDGLDGVRRETDLRFGHSATEINGERARFSITLQPQEKTTFELRIACCVGAVPRRHEPYDGALRKIRSACDQFRASLTLIETSNPQFNGWIFQSQADLHMLITETPRGPYPFAGIPWYSCVFGRDGIITALETLWCDPQLARGVLSYLASTQATQSIAAKDAEPGKIVHEERKGEMAATEEIPFGNYYGTIDATPLFVVLAGRYYERTTDKEFIREFWPSIENALTWIDRYGDCDGDGFVEYCRRTDRGLGNQGWKDSEDSVFHADGSLAEAPIALCEVQGYVFEAKTVAARLATVLGDHERARELSLAADRLKQQFERDFWCEEIQTYALALDGHKQPCKVRSSNAGHCLFSGIASEEHAASVAEGLVSEAFYSGWGIRTIPTGEPRYNPMSYHNGSIWPHDNALIASGLARYGFKRAAANILSVLFDASLHMDLNRLPELYCGFPRRAGEGPILYPVACNPQAWAAATVFSLIQSCLGLRIETEADRVCFDNPCLPAALQALTIKNLRLPSGSVDLLLERYDSEVAVAVKQRTGNVRVVVAH